MEEEGLDHGTPGVAVVGWSIYQVDLPASVPSRRSIFHPQHVPGGPPVFSRGLSSSPFIRDVGHLLNMAPTYDGGERAFRR